MGVVIDYIAATGGTHLNKPGVAGVSYQFVRPCLKPQSHPDKQVCPGNGLYIADPGLIGVRVFKSGDNRFDGNQVPPDITCKISKYRDCDHYV